MGGIIFLLMLFVIVCGVPIYAATLAASFVGFWLLGGPTLALTQFTKGPYSIMANYGFAVVPLFVVMGELASEAGIAEKAYEACLKWLGKLRGGVLITTILGNAFFGACSGIPMAGTFVFYRLAMPQIEKYKYDRSLGLATIASSAILATLIPPSVPIVILCVLLELSVGKALIATIVPGILTTFLMALGVVILGKFKPEKVPAIPDLDTSWRSRFVSLNSLWPVIGLFVLIVGGIYGGVFPPTVGGAIGAFGTFIYALIKGVGLRRIWECFWNTAVVNGQIFLVVISGYLFGRFTALSGLAQAFNDVITNLHVPPMVVMFVVFMFYLIVGCIADIMSVMIITLPVIFPLVTSLGYDPYAFLIILILMQGIAFITPPIGMQVFVVSALAKENAAVVFKGVTPFFLAQVTAVWILVFVPRLVTWLPDILYGTS